MEKAKKAETFREKSGFAPSAAFMFENYVNSMCKYLRKLGTLEILKQFFSGGGGGMVNTLNQTFQAVELKIASEQPALSGIQEHRREEMLQLLI